MKRIILILLLAATPLSANAASYSFTWEGANGYRMEGAFSISNTLVKSDYINQDAVECFKIKGFLDSDPIGFWALGELTDETSWRFNFEPRTLKFRTSGRGYLRSDGQAWNMNGRGNDCGDDGFGFNIGNAAQDLCLDNKLIWASQVSPSKPFKAVRDDSIKFKKSDCEYMLMM